MAEAQSPAPQPQPAANSVKSSTASPAQAETRPQRPKTTPLHQIYALPAPIRTFPLPSFYPNNPVSLLQLAWAWASQVLSPPPAEPSVIWEAIWSPESSSVHVYDEKAIRALWEQGFYGKGNLSRSEPNWLKREKVRRGLVQTHVSEELTTSRREERIKMKWERARAEQDAIRQVRLEEARLAIAHGSSTGTSSVPQPEVPAVIAAVQAPPTGPLELLLLPNSSADVPLAVEHPILPAEAIAAAADLIPDDSESSLDTPPDQQSANGHAVNGSSISTTGEDLNGHVKSPDDNAPDEVKTVKRRKSVRFSPRVESATFQHSDPPSPSHASISDKTANGSSHGAKRDAVWPNGSLRHKAAPEMPEATGEILNKEHLQLTGEEALFLSFGLGTLKVLDPQTKTPIDTSSLLTLFRQNAVFPPLPPTALLPDDSFLLNYAVYHHFRSLGWVPRPGIKFGMDWMLYAKGPVFDHAEFGVIILPSYSHAWWNENKHPVPQKTWHWLHGVVRVLAHVHKSLVLVYVDVPPPPIFDKAFEQGPAAALKLYKIREVMVRRWSSNRNR
ncbi:hypothetical protein VDGE_09364 [Verticillium dahliae]|uniref:tRNA-intron lyase n=1 Tax=Verticillium dahliae TaxID=27337 RepID=A0A444RJX3_VERDA|nr:hypothetical protein VDGE_09364 [Verticillium dahliae]